MARSNDNFYFSLVSPHCAVLATKHGLCWQGAVTSCNDLHCCDGKPLCVVNVIQMRFVYSSHLNYVNWQNLKCVWECFQIGHVWWLVYASAGHLVTQPSNVYKHARWLRIECLKIQVSLPTLQGNFSVTATFFSRSNVPQQNPSSAWHIIFVND